METLPMGKIKTIMRLNVYIDQYGELYFYQSRLNGYYGWFGKKPNSIYTYLGSL